MTKPIMVVKICYKLLYVIQVVKGAMHRICFCYEAIQVINNDVM